MIHDCSQAHKVCLWYRKDEKFSEKEWKLCSMVPTWFIICGHPWVTLKDGDVLLINKECDLDTNGRIIIRENLYLLVDYRKEDIRVTIDVTSNDMSCIYCGGTYARGHKCPNLIRNGSSLL